MTSSALVRPVFTMWYAQSRSSAALCTSGAPAAAVRNRAQLPPPLPGQPGPFSLGGPGLLEKALTGAGFQNVTVETVPSPLRLPSAAECVRFERESFGALHQMLAGLPADERSGVWDEIENLLRRFETGDGFVGPCEMLIGSGTR